MSAPSRRTGTPLRILITGSNRGIGRVTARYLAEQGNRVVINGRDADRLEMVRAELSADGLDVSAAPGDISDPEQASAVIEQAVRVLGGLDVLVNNAAVAMRGSFAELTHDVVDRIMRINVSGTVMTTVKALPHLRESRGSVIFVSSLAGLWGFPLISVYAASKMALTAVAQSMRTELSGAGVHVGVLHVGITQHDADKAILAVDGSPYKLAPRPGADTQEHVARAIGRMISGRRRTMVLTAGGHLLSVVSRLFPRLLALLLRGAGSRIQRTAR